MITMVTIYVTNSIVIAYPHSMKYEGDSPLMTATSEIVGGSLFRQNRTFHFFAKTVPFPFPSDFKIDCIYV